MSIISDLGDVYHIVPRFEESILSRARTLHPVWVRANTALAALTPPGDPITRPIGGVPHTTAMLLALLDGFTGLTQAASNSRSTLKQKLRGPAQDRPQDRPAEQGLVSGAQEHRGSRFR